TSTTLGKDYSGNGNNWTPNNFSVTAGAGNDSLVDTPTPYGSDSGAGGEVRGNYCVWNPLAKGSDATLANGNLDVSFGSTISTTQQSATLGMSSGKWYWEVTITASSASPTFAVVGITTKQFGDSEYPGYTSTSWGYRGSDGQKWTNTSGSSYGASYTTNDVIGIAFDADAGTLTFYKNGTSQGTAYSSLAAGTYFPAIGDQSSSNTFTAATNFGQRPFAYTAPSGYKALCTQNLPTPTVVQGDDYFNTVLYSGTGSSQSITGVGFQPDFSWIKSRSAATDHGLYDAVRGVQKQLESNNSDSETTESTGLTAFGSDGFTVGALAQLNTSAATYAAWNWKANGAGSSNTQGTITATVSANQTAGFSVLTYTGNGTSGATVGHGLGATPTFLIWRRRSYLENWGVFVSAVCAYGQQLYLNFNTNLSTLGQQRITGLSSTLITFGTDNTEINASGFTYVIYAFAPIPGYSAFGSYVGNANTDGPFVYTGFRPAFILLKSSSGTATDWIILDDKRNTYNVASDILLPDTSAAEGTDQYSRTDFLSNGFKARSGGTYGFNISGTTYIYAAFAENPFKYALAR
ncbi:MAG: hypothetical protein EBT15_11040, partial [Betaproteobacteria bacterium]|nr:hypothetical protein [Betaproteobacteria bacterium]